ncbi:MAG TPA: patatin-like phospholipase family protein [Micromonosporaceae bacterium]
MLGAGGVLGAAWMAGALPAVERSLGHPAADTDLIIGTSAGSVLAAALRCGVPVESIVSHQRGVDTPWGRPAGEFDRESGPLPPMPRLRLGSPRLLTSVRRGGVRISPWVVASGLMPLGRGQHDSLAGLLNAMLAQADGRITRGTVAWPCQPTWIMSIDYDTGRRVAFGRPDAPPSALPDAVVASCSIPGWHAPKVINGRRYVDGGVHSTTSLELVGQVAVDRVVVLAPMASYRTDRPRNPAVQAERLLRRLYTAGLSREVALVRAAGIEVTVLAPGPEDLHAIGANLMDPSRRERVLETSLRTSADHMANLRWRPTAGGQRLAS